MLIHEQLILTHISFFLFMAYLFFMSKKMAGAKRQLVLLIGSQEAAYLFMFMFSCFHVSVLISFSLCTGLLKIPRGKTTGCLIGGGMSSY